MARTGRPPLALGTYGKISTYPVGNGYRARAKFRDYDGITRPVTRMGRTKTAAENALKAAMRDRGEVVAADIITRETKVKTLADLWLTTVIESNKATQTKQTYATAVEAYVKPALGDLRISEARTSAIARALRAIRDNHGPGSAKTTKSVLSGMLDLAVQNDAITSNPAREAIKLPSTAREKPRALTVEETNTLTDLLRASERAVMLDLPDLIEWMLYTGCRIGEACAARPAVIDLEHRTWEVNATVVREKGVGLFIQEHTKTDAGWRVLALPDGAIEMLKRRAGETRLAAPVTFGSPNGKLRDPSNTQADFREVFAHIGCPGCGGTGEDCETVGPFAWITSHTFRKTVATRLEAAGLTPREVADQLGHRNPSMTMDVYFGRHVVSAKAAEALDR